MDDDRRFALLKELSHDPPFWFHHALMFCRFERSQLNHVLEGAIHKRPGDFKEAKIKEIDEIGMSYMVWRFLVRAANCTDEWKSLLELPLARHDWTYVHLASAYGDTECLKILLKQPGNQNHQVLSAATELEGFTPLHLAAYYGHPAIVKLLLEHADKFPLPASDVQEEVASMMSSSIPKDRIFKRSPLHYASLLCYPEVVSLLVNRWGSLGVDLQDYFGITPLHLAVCPAPVPDASVKSQIVLSQLIEVSKDPNKKVSKDFALQQVAMLCLFLDRRRYIDSTTSTVFIPSPMIADGFFWSIPGFTVLHCIALYGNEDMFDIVLRHDGDQALFDWAAEDCHRLNPLDYADVFSRFNDFFQAQVPKVVAIAEAHQEQKIFVNRKKANSKLVEAAQTVDRVLTLRWAYEMCIYLLSGSYSMVLRTLDVLDNLVIVKFRPGVKPTFKVDDEIWDHIEWALDKALPQESEKSRSMIISGPPLHPSDAEEMVLRLVQKRVLHGKSPKQRCLQWAIGKRMARLAEELVKDTECEVVSVVPGGKHEESPLARASKVAKDMPGLLAAMELREDVKRRWFEDRQVYVDYANTVLVGAVLIAGLAFAGWLQPPRGYVEDMGVIDMKRHTMREFVWSSSLAFFLGMGTVVAGATGAMPFAIGTGQLVSAREKVRKSVFVASMLLVASIVCLSISFSYALLAILPFSHNLAITSFLLVNGLFLCCMLLSFLRRLQGLGSSIFTVSYSQTSKWVRNLLKKKQQVS